MAHLSVYDVALIVCVSLFGTMAALARDPQVKALFATVPVPFSLAWLAVGEPVSLNNALGIFIVWGYAHLVRISHDRWNIPIIPAIVGGVSFYLGSARVFGLWFAEWQHHEGFFVAVCAAASLSGVLTLRLQRYDAGVLYRTPMALWTKFLVILGIVSGLVWMKRALAGFITFFPMMNTITSYEARHSLSTQCRQIPVFMAAAGPMLMIMRYIQVHGHQGKWITLAGGISAYMAIFLPLNAWVRRRSLENA